MPRETQINIRVSFEEKRRLEEQAKREHEHLAEWMRRVLLEVAEKGAQLAQEAR